MLNYRFLLEIGIAESNHDVKILTEGSEIAFAVQIWPNNGNCCLTVEISLVEFVAFVGWRIIMGLVIKAQNDWRRGATSGDLEVAMHRNRHL